MNIIKQAAGGGLEQVREEDLEEINRWSRRTLKAE